MRRISDKIMLPIKSLLTFLVFTLFTAELSAQVSLIEQKVQKVIDDNGLVTNKPYLDSLTYKDVSPLIEAFDQIGDKRLKADVAYILAHYYMSSLNAKQSIEFYNIAASSYQSIKESGLYLNVVKDLCNAYRIFEKINLIESTLKSSIAYSQRNNVGFYALDPIMELCVHYAYTVGNYKEAIKYGNMFLDSLEKFKRLDIKNPDFEYSQSTDAAIVDLELGHSYVKTNNYKKAEYYLTKSLKFFMPRNDKEKLTRIYQHLLALEVGKMKELGASESFDSLQKYSDLQRKAITSHFFMNPYYLQEIDSLKHKQLINKALIVSLEKERYYILGISLIMILLGGVTLWHIRQSKEKQEQINNLLTREYETSQKLSRDKSKYFAIISHELRTPIYAITGLSRLLKNKDNNNIENINSIINSSDHLLHLVNNVLQHNYLEESDGITLNKEVFDLNEIFIRAKQIISFIADQKKINVKINNTLTGKHYILGDQQKLIQIAINLITNAVRYSNPNGSITLNLILLKKEAKYNTYHFSFIDNGIGISPEKIDQIFNFKETNYVAASDETNQYSGLGIGLYVVSRFLEAMGSKIQVTSTLAKGSVFSFNIDLETANVDEAPHEGMLPLREVSKVMVIDDVKMNLLVTKKTLNTLGFNVITASDTDRVLEIIGSEDVDVILMDLNMPVINGYDLSLKIREVGYTMPIIAHTAMSNEDINHDLLRKADIQSILIKPYPINELESKIFASMSKSKAFES